MAESDFGLVHCRFCNRLIPAEHGVYENAYGERLECATCELCYTQLMELKAWYAGFRTEAGIEQLFRRHKRLFDAPGQWYNQSGTIGGPFFPKPGTLFGSGERSLRLRDAEERTEASDVHPVEGGGEAGPVPEVDGPNL